MADSPWLCKVDRGLFARDLQAVRAYGATHVLSSHLPAASGTSLDRMLDSLVHATAADPFVGPDQVAFEQMLATMGAPAPA
jgi:hypothetical protein